MDGFNRIHAMEMWEITHNQVLRMSVKRELMLLPSEEFTKRLEELGEEAKASGVRRCDK